MPGGAGLSPARTKVRPPSDGNLSSWACGPPRIMKTLQITRNDGQARRTGALPYNMLFLEESRGTHDDQPPGILSAHRGYRRRGCVRQFSVSFVRGHHPETG